MATLHWATKISTVIVGTLLHLELSALIVTKPAQGQIYPGQLQPAVVPVQPDSGQLPVVDSFFQQPGLNQLVPANSSATPTSPKFTFTSVLEYSNCLESVLQLYQNPSNPTQSNQQNPCAAELQQIYRQQGLSKSQALELISGANFYATTLLERQIFPPRGQRRRIAQLFKFIYEVDANDSEMHRLATQN